MKMKEDVTSIIPSLHSCLIDEMVTRKNNTFIMRFSWSFKSFLSTNHKYIKVHRVEVENMQSKHLDQIPEFKEVFRHRVKRTQFNGKGRAVCFCIETHSLFFFRRD